MNDEKSLLQEETEDSVKCHNVVGDGDDDDYSDVEYFESKNCFGHAIYSRRDRWRLESFRSSVMTIKEDSQKYGNHLPVYLFNNTKRYAFLLGPDHKSFLWTLLSILFISGLVLCFPAWCVSFNFGLFCLAVLTVFLTFFFRVSLRDPGIIPRRDRDLSVVEEGDSDTNKRLKICKTCNIIRTKGVFHCQICDVCIEGMDHHCPFTGHCIGKRNLVDFYLFLASLYLALTVYMGALMYFAIYFVKTGGHC